jgi:hypothetical protein
MLSLVTSLLLVVPVPAVPQAKGGGLAWSRDYDRAYVEAAERQAPLLIHFRGANCGSRSAPGAAEQRDAAGMAGGITRPLHDTELNDCDLMQKDVWEDGVVTQAAARFVAVLADGGDQKLNVRYQVVVNPTTLVTDPWGNEIFRVTHYLEREKMARLLQAIPADFAPLAPFGRALRDNSHDLPALIGAAAYYQGQRLPQVSERLYEKAGASPQAAADLAVRRQVAIARGLNLLLMGKDKDAAGVFDKALGEAPTGAGSDALLLGLVNAHLQGGRRKEAEAALKTLEKGWPGSPYAARARQNFEAAPPKR